MYVNGYGLLDGDSRVKWQLLPETWTQQIIVPRLIILHSQAGPRRTPWESLVAFMRRADIVTEAHLMPELDGTIIQTIPFNVRADCNYKANPFAISMETQDNGGPTLEVTPWSLEQLDVMVNAIAAIGHKYGIPYTNPTSWVDAGVGYHSQYKEWSSFTGKTCPGAARIRQMDWVRTTAAGICACPPDVTGEVAS